MTTSYVPLAQADFPAEMGTTGYDKSIGPLPEWDVAYLTSGADIRAWRAIQVNGYCCGRYGLHYRDNTTNRPLRFSQYPNKTLNTNTSGVADYGTSADPTPAVSGTSPPLYKNSHTPAFGYMAYLVTGRFYFMEAVQFHATLNYLKQGDHPTLGRNLSQGLLMTNQGSNQVRGAAWSLRTLAMAAQASPDDDALHAEFVSSIEANIAEYHSQYVLSTYSNLGLAKLYGNIVTWQDDFLTFAFGFMKDTKVYGATASAKLDAFLAYKYKAIVGRLGGQAADQFCYKGAAMYDGDPALVPSANWGSYYTSYYGVANTCDSGGTALSGTSGADPGNMATGYWGNLQPALSYAVDHGAANAASAYNRLTNASNWASGASGFNDSPTWSVKPRSV
jgi:hypothetical protein